MYKGFIHSFIWSLSSLFSPNNSIGSKNWLKFNFWLQNLLSDSGDLLLWVGKIQNTISDHHTINTYRNTEHN